MAAEPSIRGPNTDKAGDICLQCRNRKVRCDRAVGGCENCHRLGFACSLSPDAAHSIDGRQGRPGGPANRRAVLERRRSRRACLQCREKKAKCSNELPSCERCLQRRLQCQYKIPYPTDNSSQVSSTEARSPSGQGSHGPSSVPHTGSVHSVHQPITMNSPLDMSKIALRQHIDAFFEYVVPIPCYGFLHRASLMHKWQQGNCNARLLKAICGISARFISQHSSSDDEIALGWINEAEKEILGDLDNLAVSDVEALILIALDHCIARRFVRMLSTSCLAARMAYIMRLNHENSKLGFIAQESRRRLMWAIFVFDTLYSSGRSELTSCPRGTIHLHLPCRDRAFSLDTPVTTENLGPPPDAPVSENLGTTGFLIRLLDIRDRIQRFVQSIVQRQKDLADSLHEFKELESELAAFQHSIPATHKFTRKNLFVRVFTPKRTSFVMLHAWWHQCHCHLYRLTVTGFREALPAREVEKLPFEFRTFCQEQCLHHALAAIEVIGSVKELGEDLWITDPALAVCAFHLARIVSRFSRPPFSKLNAEDLNTQLQMCLDCLEKQAELYPTTRLLRKSIHDLLLHGTQPVGTRSSSQSRVSSNERSGTGGPGGTANPRPNTVYSRFSVMDEVQRLQFPNEEESPVTDAIADREPLSWNATVDQRVAIHEDLPEAGYEPDPMLETHPELDSGLPMDETPFSGFSYDVSMLGLDFGYGADVLDSFVDTEFPFQQSWDENDPFPRQPACFPND